jgi:hypothetical protein
VAKLIVTYWRDIPAQVVGKRGRTSVVKQELPEQFAKAIDRAAMRAGRGSSDAYLADWRRESVEVPGDELEQAVAAEADRLVALFPDEVLRATILNHGLVQKDTPDA